MVATDIKHRLLSDEEEMRILTNVVNLLNEGEEEKAHEEITKIPLPTYLAKALEAAYGADFLNVNGYNLALLEQKHGEHLY